jgi:NAD(P)-dependent dehydrogenase (short-subunit alcohol dehydrogenase family)
MEERFDPQKSFSLEGKLALVTGATYGIGFAIATALAQAGAKIAFNDRRQERIDEAEKKYSELGIDSPWLRGRCHGRGAGQGPHGQDP